METINENDVIKTHLNFLIERHYYCYIDVSKLDPGYKAQHHLDELKSKLAFEKAKINKNICCEVFMIPVNSNPKITIVDFYAHGPVVYNL